MAGSDNHSNGSMGDSSMRRRRVIQSVGAGATASLIGLAGCLGDDEDDDTADDGVDDTDDTADDDDEPAEEYPSEPITWVVPYGSGSGSDAYARALTGVLSDNLGVDFPVTNISGAGAHNGLREVAESDPDGYTFGNGVLPGNAIAYFTHEADYAFGDMTIVCTFAASSMLLVANPDEGLENDFVAWNQRYGDGELVNIGGTEGGMKSVPLVMRESDDFEFTYEEYIGYDGTGPTLEAVAAGEVPTAVAGAIGAALPMIEDGLVVPVAWLGSIDNHLLEGVPNVEGEGYPNIDHVAAVTRPVYAPPGTPSDVVDTMADAVEEAIGSDELQDWSEETGRDFSFVGPEQAQGFLEDGMALADEIPIEEL